MLNRKLLIITSILLIATMLLGASPAKGWPGDGSIYVMQVSDAPVIDGKVDSGEWTTDEEVFRDTIDGLSFPGSSVSSLRIDVVILQDTDNLYVKVEIVDGLASPSTNISVGLAFGNELLLPTMQGTFDRKVAYYNGTGMTKHDLVGCFYIDQELCNEDPYYLQPGIPDSTVDFDAQYGVVDGNVMFEFSVPKTPTNATEDIEYQDTVTNLRIVCNPVDDIARNHLIGHGAKATNILYLQDNPRAFFQPPEGDIDTMTLIFNAFMALMITGMFASFILSRINDSIAARSWKVDVSEEMASKSVLMEMAYYNSSFLSILFVVFFMVYALIGVLYGLWAGWVELIIIDLIPLIVGAIAIYMLYKDNYNPQEEGREKPGVDVSESDSFWIVPTAFLALVLLMLVFIGIDVIA